MFSKHEYWVRKEKVTHIHKKEKKKRGGGRREE